MPAPGVVETPRIFSSVRPVLSGIPRQREAEVEAASGQLLDILSGLFPYTDETCQPKFIKEHDARAKQALINLIGTARTRMGPMPNEDAQAQMLVPVMNAVRGAKLVQLYTVWGTSRDPDNPDANFAELADLSGIMMLQAAADRIKAAHNPGAWIRILVENAACLWLDVKNWDDPREVERTKTEMNKYFQTKLRMFHVLTKATGNGSPIEWVLETELLNRMGFPLDRYLEDCRMLKPLFECYLNESLDIMNRFLQTHSFATWDEVEQLGEAEYEKLWKECEANLITLDSYAALQKVGWTGLITPGMRRFYGKKNISLHPELRDNPHGLNAAIAHYFASTLEKQSLGVGTYGMPFPETMVKVPLVPLASGRPQKYQASIPLRSAPKDTTRKAAAECTAPWIEMGLYADGLLHVNRLSQVTTSDCMVVPVEVLLEGDGKVTSGKLPISYPIPAKLVLQ